MKVLIVDDEPLARNELEYLLKQNSLVDQVSQAESISQALTQLLTTPSDLVFLDISLNNENGGFVTIISASSIKSRHS